MKREREKERERARERARFKQVNTARASVLLRWLPTTIAGQKNIHKKNQKALKRCVVAFKYTCSKVECQTTIAMHAYAYVLLSCESCTNPKLLPVLTREIFSVYYTKAQDAHRFNKGQVRTIRSTRCTSYGARKIHPRTRCFKSARMELDNASTLFLDRRFDEALAACQSDARALKQGGYPLAGTLGCVCGQQISSFLLASPHHTQLLPPLGVHLAKDDLTTHA